ncbi:MAG: radical SAM protein [Candidatus Omnitrophota bacterium]
MQVTLGCSANHCSFCGAYMGKKFSIKGLEEIASDINTYARRHKDTRRVFLMDGDALAMSNEKILPVLDMLQEAFPKLARVSSYANGYNITKRDDSELRELYDRKLRLIYIGLESGNQDILERCRKRSSAEEMVEAVKRASSAGIKSSAIVLLGLGGKKYSAEHVRDTIKALNMMQPRYLSFLSLMVIPGTPLDEEADGGTFEELDSKELLQETHDMIEGLELEKTIFRSNHASNYLPLEGTFPKDKARLLTMLRSAISGNIGLRHEHQRGL